MPLKNEEFFVNLTHGKIQISHRKDDIYYSNWYSMNYFKVDMNIQTMKDILSSVLVKGESVFKSSISYEFNKCIININIDKFDYDYYIVCNGKSNVIKTSIDNKKFILELCSRVSVDKIREKQIIALQRKVKVLQKELLDRKLMDIICSSGRTCDLCMFKFNTPYATQVYEITYSSDFEVDIVNESMSIVEMEKIIKRKQSLVHKIPFKKMLDKIQEELIKLYMNDNRYGYVPLDFNLLDECEVCLNKDYTKDCVWKTLRKYIMELVDACV